MTAAAGSRAALAGRRTITVWVCDDCSYWRAEKGSGVHVTPDPADPRGRMLEHQLRSAEFVAANALAAADTPTHDVRAFMTGPVPPPHPRNDWPVHRPAAPDAPIPGRHWADGCEPGGDYDPELRTYTGTGPRVGPDGICEGCNAAACPECGHERYPDGECGC